jgi:nicotinamide riboside transporter PnuC
VALFVLIIVGIVVAQTWYDWRKNKKNGVLPDWAKGVALGGVLSVSLAAMASFASAWMQDPGSPWGNAIQSHLFWPEAGLFLVAVSAVLLMTRKKRLPWLLLLAGVILAALWVGMSIGS